MYTDTASASGGVGGLIIVSGEINNIVLFRCDNEYPNLDREEAGSWGYFTGTWSRTTSYVIVILIVIKGKEVFMLKCSCLNNAFTSIRIIHYFVILSKRPHKQTRWRNRLSRVRLFSFPRTGNT